MISFWLPPEGVKDNTFIPKYYTPELDEVLAELRQGYDVYTVGELVERGVLALATGHEIGKSAYGTGDIPFIRTSDIPNWELKSAAKQGVSREIYEEISAKQDVEPGDLLLVRDGTYLVGNTALVTEYDGELIYQSHLLRIRVIDNALGLDSFLLFASFNSPIVQARIRGLQFTADIIDTLGQRVTEIPVLVPRDKAHRQQVSDRIRELVGMRARLKQAISHFGGAMEQALLDGADDSLDALVHSSGVDVPRKRQPAVSSEFGGFQAFWKRPDEVRGSILLPTYYDAAIDKELELLTESCDLVSIGELVKAGDLLLNTGHEVGKMAYGTGNIPFLRTTDFANWEVIHNPKQGVSREIYEKFRLKQDLSPLDILLVRDGTYLVGSSCLVTEVDAESLYCGGLIRIRSASARLDPFLLLGLLNSSIVRRQFRTKQFTRDVIDTLGQRVLEVVLPIPKSLALRESIARHVEEIVTKRVRARTELKDTFGSFGQR